MNIIDQCVAQGVPFAREYGGLLANRSFGGAQVSRTFYARGQTGQQLAARRVSGAGAADRRRQGEDVSAHRDARSRRRRRPGARASSTRDLVTGEIESHVADAVVLGDRRLRQRLLSLDEREGLATSPRSGAPTSAARLFANPCFTQIHPTCIPVSGDYQSKLTLMTESLRNDGRVWVPKKKGDKRAAEPDSRKPSATTTSSGSIRASATSRRATSRRAPPRKSCDEGRGVGEAASASISISPTRSSGSASERIASATATCSRCTSASPARIRTRCRCASIPAVHYTMGGLWVDYNLMSNDPRPVRASARRISPITARTVSAPAR